MKEITIIKELLTKNPLLFIEILLDKNQLFKFSSEELVILQYLWLVKSKQNINPSNGQLAELANLEEKTVRMVITKLIQENYIGLISTEADGKISEEYDLSPLINKCFDATIMSTKPTNALQQFVEKVELEFSRNLSPIEIQYIQTWIYDDHLSIDILDEALKESVLAGVRNFKYMSAIINNWQTNKQQANISNKYGMKESFQKSKTKEFSAEEKEIAKFDWERALNEDE